jgi:hypothetical protein
MSTPPLGHPSHFGAELVKRAPEFRRDDVLRFLSFCALQPLAVRTETRGEPCWIWHGGTADARPGHAHGRFRLNGKLHTAHRLAYGWWTGHTHGLHLDPRREICLHECDNPRCVNPAHITLGTVAENNAQTLKRGRHRTPISVNQRARDLIVAAHGVGLNKKQLSRAFEVTGEIIHRVLRERAKRTYGPRVWKHGVEKKHTGEAAE